MMEYKEILDNARTCSGPYCKVCPVCNGKACGNTVPGPGAKGPGSVFVRNYDKWQSVCVNMDTICENVPCDTTLELFGQTYRYPFFAAPVGAMKLHYGDKYDDLEYKSSTTATSTTIWPIIRSSSRPAPTAASPLSPATGSMRRSWTARLKRSRKTTASVSRP